MKKLILSALVVLFSFIAIPKVAKAVNNDDDLYAKVNLSINMPTGVVGDITIKLTNITTDEDVTVFISSKQGYKYSFVTKFGTYTLKSSSISTIEGHTLDYTVAMDDFVLDMSNPNGNWSWDIVGDVKAIVPTRTPKPKTPTQTAEANEGEGHEQNTDITTFVIDGDNAYFSNMTIPQIQEWYTSEVLAFIESGKNDLTLNEYQEDVTRWADWVSRKNDSTLNISYRVNVNTYNKDDTKDFYEVQKKIYDFLREYYKEHNRVLNFGTWIYEDVIVDTPTGTEENNNPKPTETIVTPEPTKADMTVTPEPTKTEVTVTPEPTTEVTVTTEPTAKPKENKFLSILKSAWFTLIIFAVLGIGMIIWKIKYKQTND